MYRFRGLILALALALATRAERLPPVDESVSDPDFLAFKIRLLAAISRNDARTLAAATDPAVAAPMTVQLWKEVASVLRLGATRDDAA